MVTLTLRTVESILTNFKNFAKTFHDHFFTRVTDGLHKAIEVQEGSILKNWPAKLELVIKIILTRQEYLEFIC